MKFLIAAATTALLAAPAFAESHVEMQGDAEAGETVFSRQCVACHVVENADGEVLAGRNGRIGPNLYGVAGRTAGTVEGFAYGDDMVAAGESGVTWTEENFVPYVQDPSGWLKEALDDSGARGKMMFQVRSEEDAQNVYAYLASLAPAEGEAAPSN